MTRYFRGSHSWLNWQELKASAKVTFDNGSVLNGVKAIDIPNRIYALSDSAPPQPPFDSRWESVRPKYVPIVDKPGYLTITWVHQQRDIGEIYARRCNELNNLVESKSNTNDAVGVNQQVLAIVGLMGDDSRTIYLPKAGTEAPVVADLATRDGMVATARDEIVKVTAQYHAHWVALKQHFDNDDIQALAAYDIQVGW